MSQQDRTVSIVVNHQSLKQAADQLLPPGLFRGIRARRDARWKPRMLVVCALLIVTGGQGTPGAAFDLARKVVAGIFRWLPAPGTSYQGFVKQLRRWHSDLTSVVLPHLQSRMRETLSARWKVAGFVVFAGDGSRIALARTAALEQAFSPKRKRRAATRPKTPRRPSGRAGTSAARTAKKKRKKKRQSAGSIEKKSTSPQMWLTLMWHVGSGLPWDWRTGPSDSSERAHLGEMLPELPPGSLITADAGFVGYGSWSRIPDAGHHFVIRVGGNAKLLRDLGYARQYDHTVSLWPDQAAKNNQPPLTLRLIEVHDGRQPVYLVTDLPKHRLSDRQTVEIYRARWGIELFFRTFRQTFGCRRLQSHTAENARWELDWSLIGVWCVCLLGAIELAASGRDPTRLSAAAAIAAFRTTIAGYRVRPESVQDILWQKLRAALLDDYQRSSSKTSRNHPRRKHRDRTQPPEIKPAGKEQVAAARELRQNPPGKWLTA